MLTRMQLVGLVSGALSVFLATTLLVLMLYSRQEEAFDVHSLGKALQASPSTSPGQISGSNIVNLGGDLKGILDLSSVSQRMTKLQEENEQLRKMLKRAIEYNVVPKAAAGAAKAKNRPTNDFSTEDSSVCIDMVDFLGTVGYYVGVSYDPKVCYPSLNTSFFKLAGPEAVASAVQRAKQDLIKTLAAIKNVDVSVIAGRTDKMFHEVAVGAMKYPESILESMKMLPHDPEFLRWRDAISVILARYLADPDGNLYVNCPGVPVPADVNKLGTYCHDVPAREVIKKFGYYVAPFESIDSIVSLGLIHGMCSTHVRNFRNSYVDWLKSERMSEEWRTFNAPSMAADQILFLFDMLYEKQVVFTRQFWMGVVTMQNPFDMYSIQDIIYTIKPELLIETGTASGGSALLWSGIMELADLEDSKIITMDLNPPSVWNDPSGIPWREDPLENKLWKKRVTFLQGHTLDPQIIDQVKLRAQAAQKVLVTLDSGHDKEHVAKEMETYCPLVSVGSYCIVEDTKMSRWHSDGPLEAVKYFVSQHPEFVIDRDRELLYSHHVSGYLKRIA